MKDSSLENSAIGLASAFDSAAAEIDKPAPRRREPPLSIRMTAKEKAYLRKAAGDQPVSGYVRAVLFDDRLSIRQRGRTAHEERTAIAQILSLLGRSEIAASLRSLAAAAECGALPVSEDVLDQLRDACAEVRLIRRTLLNALGVKTDA